MTAPRKRLSTATLVLVPFWAVVLAAYVGTMLWTVQISFTASKLLPVDDYVGFAQYERLFSSTRWIVSMQNAVIFGVLFITGALVLGFLLAVVLDQRVRFENTLRTIFLYPYAMSFIVTGLIWQWLMNPGLGIQKTVRDWGFESFSFAWAVDRDMALYALVLAGLWQASGLVMALMLAGLRGVDEEIWKASRIDGIPAWRVYLFVVVPMLRPLIVTAVVLLSISVVKAFDLVVALTNGGPGISSDMPAKFVMDNLFTRQNIGLATAAATVMLITVAAVLVPWIYAEYFRKARKGAAA
ncbi:sugar ABC transporter permease [Aurantimonas sp. 22II-16-19i]|uniref:carbohydrate ABC transporter permease n=1 Tax=Aurantimonas sp. 22II-16-19i TaxID=1317114 RepID=UPI0009F7AC7C|nr:sugar ABC transporter permease [Aurantimonas sp. 22II-16-19i]ORE98399.1 binding-protein-dependent transport system inner membrane protein [Aurantimonas sp. 22II-16-19i]